MRRTGARRDEHGAGLIATITGVLVFLLLMLFAVQISVALYARSAVTAATWDGARLVAGYGTGAGRDEAEAHVRKVLGRYGEAIEFEWGSDPDAVVLTVRADAPSLLPPTVRRPMQLDTIERTVRVRVERAR